MKEELSDKACELIERMMETDDHHVFLAISGAIWEAIGPDAVPNWESGGERQSVIAIADAILNEDEEMLGRLILGMAIPYMNRVAEQPYMWFRRDAA